MDQIRKNKSVLELLKKHGDKLTTVREINHWIYFKSFDDLCDYKDILSKKGFIIQNIDKNKDPNETHPFSLCISRDDRADLKSINKVTLKLSRLAEEYNGNYDGWETPIIED